VHRGQGPRDWGLPRGVGAGPARRAKIGTGLVRAVGGARDGARTSTAPRRAASTLARLSTATGRAGGAATYGVWTSTAPRRAVGAARNGVRIAHRQHGGFQGQPRIGHGLAPHCAGLWPPGLWRQKAELQRDLTSEAAGRNSNRSRKRQTGGAKSLEGDSWEQRWESGKPGASSLQQRVGKWKAGAASGGAGEGKARALRRPPPHRSAAPPAPPGPLLKTQDRGFQLLWNER